MIKFSREKILLLHKLITEDEVVRVGIDIASGKMSYEELLEWILNNK